MYISAGGIFYKGGLHIHTNISDGRKSPAEAKQLYRSLSYDFIALTDHWKFNPGSVSDGMTVLSGIEYDVGSDIRDGIFHIVGIGCTAEPALTRDMLTQPSSVEKAQFVIDRINLSGGAAILAHPAWSLDRISDIMTLDGLSGIEIYNAISGMPWGNRANSAALLDLMAADGFMLPLHAADDTHYYEGEQGSSYIYLKSESAASENLTAAIKDGDVYASRGPSLDISREGNTLHVNCSPASMIIFQTGTVWIPDRVRRGEDMTCAEYTIRPTDIFARVEVYDKNGNAAWSGYYIYK
jgi:hypothetical protein